MLVIHRKIVGINCDEMMTNRFEFMCCKDLCIQIKVKKKLHYQSKL